MSEQQFPSYIELFGNIDTTSGDEARSVLSPAAYFVDLMLLKEKQGQVLEEIDRRRPDIREIPLNRENTFSEVSYLDIANEVMAARIEKEKGSNDAYSNLKDAVYPYPVPFDKDYQQVKDALKYHRSDLVTFYKQFMASPDRERVAREALGLTEKVCTLLTSPAVTEEQLKTCWGIDDETSNEDISTLYNVSTFVQKAGLSGKAFQELLFQNLNEAEIEQGLAKYFFINNINDGENYITTDAQDPPQLILSTGEALTLEHFYRIHRFIYLSRVLGWGFTECDLVLRTACENQLDSAAIQNLAIVHYLHKKFDISLEALCVLWSDMKYWGAGPTSAPEHLFYQTFDKGYDLSIEEVYKIDKLESVNIKNRLQASLGLKEQQLELLINKVKPYLANGLDKVTVVKNLSILYRFTRLARGLEISLAELLTLCDLLDRLQRLQGHIGFELYMPLEEKAQDLTLIQILTQASELTQVFWSLQTLISVVDWLKTIQLSVAQLAFICQSEPISGIEDVLNLEAQQDLFSSLAETFEALLVKPEALHSARLDLVSAQRLYALLSRLDVGVLSEAGLVRTLPTSLTDNIVQVIYQQYPL